MSWAVKVGNLTAVPEQPESAVVAPEFVATSVSSNSRPQRLMDAWRQENPNLLLCEGERRGYLKLELRPERLKVDLIALHDVRDPASERYVLKPRSSKRAGHRSIRPDP